MPSWAKVLDSKPKPEDRLRALANAYRKYSPRTILREALGYYDNILPEVPDIARPLVDHIIVICVDTESHTLNTDQMTELGLVHISRKTAQCVGPPGPHGWKLQEALQFLHFRIAEHAHLHSNREDSAGPLGNRFGSTRFTTFQELRVILEYLFNQEIETNEPELKGCKCPIVLIGHALKHDVENTTKPGLDYDITDNLTLVAKVDTQSLAREVKVWIPPPDMSTNEIGLRVLIEKLGFEHVDDHTACNDAARTMMCAIHMILPDGLLESDNPSMQAVADRVENLSKEISPAPYGTVLVCTRCGWRDHSVEDCTANVTCAACNRFDIGPDHDENVHSHIETYCPHVARFKAWARRFRDASKKHGTNLKAFPEAVAEGPGLDAHPWSTWSRDVGWPLRELSDVLVGMNLVSHFSHLREPPAFARNMQSALGGLSVPPSGSWVMVAARGPRNGTTATASSAASSTSDGMSMTALGSAPPVVNGSTYPSAVYSPLPSASGGNAAAAALAVAAPGAPSLWSSAPPAANSTSAPTNSGTASTAAFPLLTAAHNTASAPTQAPGPASTAARRETSMSAQRARARGGSVRSCGSSGISRGGHGCHGCHGGPNGTSDDGEGAAAGISAWKAKDDW